MKPIRLTEIALLFTLLFSGCSFNQMLPVRRLEKGEVVRSIAVTEPGFLYIPRVSYAETRGTGRGDWSGYVTGTLGYGGVGVAFRRYLTGKQTNLGLLLSADRSFIETDFWGRKISVYYLNLVPSVGLSPVGNRKVFARAYGILQTALDPNSKGEHPWFAGGGVAVGGDFLLKKGNSIQVGVDLGLLCSQDGCGVLPSISLGYAFRKKPH